MMKRFGKILLFMMLLACTFSRANAQSPRQVLVVANAANASSVKLAQYYLNARGVPFQNLCLVNWDAADNSDTCTLAQYQNQIATPITNFIAARGGIDFIVLCRNLPSKISDTTGSVDSALACGSTSLQNNVYFGQRAPFTHAVYGSYLVTRLDGWSWQDAQSLIDRARAARVSGPILLDEDPSKNGNYSYYLFNYYMDRAYAYLSPRGVNISVDQTSTYMNSSQALMGYVSWGSNDACFSWTTYNSLRFAPGAIAETAVSTSASNIRYPGGGQSQIAQLVHNGISGIKGYVSEPQVVSTAQAHIMLINYVVTGRNLAESFYSASKYMGWKDVVIGDPLCMYASSGPSALSIRK